jgi:hypothetical protein
MAVKPAQPQVCELCGREKTLTFHHLIPKKMHRKGRTLRRFDRAELHTRGLWLCRLCHRQIHRFYSEDELAETLNTREAIVRDPRMSRFLKWARKQK